MIRRCAVALAAVLATAVGIGLGPVPPAHADQMQVWRWGDTVQTTYNDTRNALCGMDLAKDGHSIYVAYHFRGGPTHKIWVHTGQYRMECHHFAASNENRTVIFKACTAEWATSPSNRRTIRCSVSHSFWV